jgi:hypothetical protein
MPTSRRRNRTAIATLVAIAPPGTDLTDLPANGGFYFRAFNVLVVRPVAGYDHNSDWTPVGGTFTRWNGS